MAQPVLGLVGLAVGGFILLMAFVLYWMLGSSTAPLGDTSRGFFIDEETWTGKTVRTTRFAAADIVAVIADVKDSGD